MRLAQVRAHHAVLGGMSVLLGAVMVASLSGRMEHDTAWMLYLARLIDQHGYVPYRDLFDINMPGAYFSHILIGRLIGYTDDFRLRVFDLAYLCAISLVTWVWLSRIGRAAAWSAIVMFGLFYLGGGTQVIMQREYLVLLPIAGAAALTSAQKPANPFLRCLIIGIQFGLAATVKPQMAIGLVAVWAALVWELHAAEGRVLRIDKRVVLCAVSAAAGFAIPTLAVIAYLLQTATLSTLAGIASNYAPIYSRLTYELTMIPASERPLYLLTELARFGGWWYWWLPAAAGLFVTLRSPAMAAPARRQIGLMIGLAASYAVYPVLSGQFFSYHWLPFMYFLIALTSLCFADAATSQPAWQRIGAAAIALTVSAATLLPQHLNGLYVRFVLNQPSVLAEIDTADGIAAYLNARKQPGDAVQWLDWGQGAMHAMLLTDTPPATPYIADVMFFQDVASAYTQSLRRDFVKRLEDNPPPFVVDVTGQLFPTGPGTSREFPELTTFLNKQYAVTYIGHGFVVYEPPQGVSQAVVVYPLDEAEALKGFRTNQGDTFALTPERAGDEAYIVERLSELVDSHDLITVEFPTGQSDPGGVIERWLAEHAFKLPETRIQDTRVLNYLIGVSACHEDQAVGAELGEVMKLATAATALMPVRDDSIVCIQLGWQALEATPISYKIATHIVAPDGSIIAQYDSVPMGYLSPTNTWTAGQEIVDRYAIPLPADLAAGTYTIRVIVYDESTGERLTVGGNVDFVEVGEIVILK